MRFRTLAGAAMIGGIALLFLADTRLESRPLIPALLLALALGGWAEFVALTGLGTPPKGGRTLSVLGAAAVVHFFAVQWISGRWALPGGADAWIQGGIAGLVGGAFLAVVLRPDFEACYPALLETIAGALLLGLLLSYLVKIYGVPGTEGPLLWAIILGGIKGNDMAAYYVGKAWGRRHPFPVSPKKTMAGSVGAIIFSLAYFGAAGWLLNRSFPSSPFRWPGGMLFGVIMSVASQVGDLGESLFKRVYRVKDSSRLLPEFGGILDLVDSLIFAGFLGSAFWGPR